MVAGKITGWLIVLALLAGILSGPCLGNALALESGGGEGAEEAVPELKPLKPKFHKVEPYKAGVQHNQVLKPKKKKVQKKKLRASSRADNYKGKDQSASLDNSRLDASADSTMLNSAALRGIGIIGVKFIAEGGLPPVINQVFRGTPAAEQGLRPNDAIVAVDGVPTYGLTREECYDLIVGSPNTPVTLSIRRGSNFSVHTMMRMDFTELTDPAVRRAYGVNL
ncbi:PDZ domain-containing protein [bacterium]|nr:PDZ domain-containing protein [bacterium]